MANLVLYPYFNKYIGSEDTKESKDIPERFKIESDLKKEVDGNTYKDESKGKSNGNTNNESRKNTYYVKINEENVEILGFGYERGREREGQGYIIIDRQIRQGDVVDITIGPKNSKPNTNDNETYGVGPSKIKGKGEVKNIKGSPFKDERVFSAQIMMKNANDISDARVKFDYKDYVPCRGIRRGRVRWGLSVDLSNREENIGDFMNSSLEFQFARYGLNNKTNRFNVGFGISGSASYYPKDVTHLFEAGGVAAGEFSWTGGNDEKQRDIFRFAVKPEFSFGFLREKAYAGEGNNIRYYDYYKHEYYPRLYIPANISYCFDGFRLMGEVGFSFLLAAEDRTNLGNTKGLRTKYPRHVGFKLSLDPTLVKGMPFGLDGQSIVGLNLIFEHGRKPHNFAKMDNVISIAFEFAPNIGTKKE